MLSLDGFFLLVENLVFSRLLVPRVYDESTVSHKFVPGFFFVFLNIFVIIKISYSFTGNGVYYYSGLINNLYYIKR